MESTQVQQVRLIGYPVGLGARQQEHLDEVTREFVLLSLSRPEARDQVPGRLLELVEVLTERWATELEGPRAARERALAEGRDRIELVYPVLAGMREAVQRWAATMREVDAYCREDELLSLATPPDVVALQEWVVGQFVAQLDGQPPTPWPGSA